MPKFQLWTSTNQGYLWTTLCSWLCWWLLWKFLHLPQQRIIIFHHKLHLIFLKKEWSHKMPCFCEYFPKEVPFCHQIPWRILLKIHKSTWRQCLFPIRKELFQKYFGYYPWFSWELTSHSSFKKMSWKSTSFGIKSYI